MTPIHEEILKEFRASVPVYPNGSIDRASCENFLIPAITHAYEAGKDEQLGKIGKWVEEAREAALDEAKNEFAKLQEQFPQAMGTDWENIVKILASLKHKKVGEET